LDVAVWRAQGGEGWIVRIEQRADRCGRPGDANLRDYDWWQVYRVSGAGEVLARASHPAWDDTSTWPENAGLRELLPEMPDGGVDGGIVPGSEGAGVPNGGASVPAGERGFVSGADVGTLTDAGAGWKIRR
jgi:hypothetical protein